jgi:hypothetical protein
MHRLCCAALGRLLQLHPWLLTGGRDCRQWTYPWLEVLALCAVAPCSGHPYPWGSAADLATVDALSAPAKRCRACGSTAGCVGTSCWRRGPS